MPTRLRSPGRALLVTLLLASAGILLLVIVNAPEDEPWDGVNGDPDAPVYPVMGIAHVKGDTGGALGAVPLSVDVNGTLIGEPVMRFTEREATLGRALPVYDVLAWHRPCLPDASPVLATGFRDADHRLRFDASEGPDAWYADRHGEAVRAWDVPEGAFARVTWRAHDADRVTLLLARVAPESVTPEARPFTVNGLVAFSDRSPHDCARVHPAGDVAGGWNVIADIPGHEEDGILVVDATHENAWNPRLILRDIVDAHGAASADRPHPLPEATRFQHATACDEGLTPAVHLGQRARVTVPPGGNVTEAFTLTTRDVAFRNVTWHAFLTPPEWDRSAWSNRLLDVTVDGPLNVSAHDTVIVNVTLPLPPDLPEGAYRLGVTWAGELQACAREWVPLDAGARGTDAGTPLAVTRDA